MAEHIKSGVSDIAENCAAFTGAIKEALVWINDPRNAECLQPDKRAIEEDLRRAAFQARKVAQAALKPMCVGVFGPSQSGKSYLVSVLARKNSKLTAVFDDPRGSVDFIAEINPKGGKEATGLVTRFTIHPVKTPHGFPVSLRLLSQTDLVKIIINTYVNDGDLDLEELPSREDFIAHLEKFEKGASADYADKLREEDVWDLQDYVQKNFRRIDAQFSAFWDRIAQLAPRVSLTERASLYSILWGKHEPLTMLYLKLAEGLARLGFADGAFAEMESLVPSDQSILNVDTLSMIGKDDASTLKIVTGNGPATELPRSVVAALTAELGIVAAECPWDFFEHTDLLDFPGYRSRKKEDLQKHFAMTREAGLAEMLLRGKVDYLFQRYTQDQELTSILLCLRDSNLEVKTLPDVIEDWIGVTHGGTPEERAGMPTLLFFCLTMFDNHLIERAGDEHTDPGERLAARMQASLLSPFGSKAGTWPLNWAPGKAFDNCYWIRNPNVKAESVIEYDGWREVSIKKDKVERLEALRTSSNQVPALRQHFKDPLRAFDEVMKLNDGGISYLAENLAKVCLPQMKADQLRTRLAALRRKMSDRIARYYVTTDLDKRLREREEVCEQILHAIEECVGRNRFGTFLSALCIDRAHLGDTLYVARTTGLEPDSTGGIAGARPARSGSITGILIGGQRPAAQPRPRPTGNIQLGNAAVQMWASHMQKISESEPFARTIGIPTSLMREAVAEISGAARRHKVNEEIAARLDRILHIENNDAIVAKATLTASRILNNFICTFGYDKKPPEQRPKVPIDENNERPIFHTRPVVHDASGIGEESEPFAFNLALDWCTALQASVRDNASSEDGSMRDPVQNAKLGKILEGLKS